MADMMSTMMGFGWFGMLGAVFNLLLLALLMLAMVLAVRYMSRRGSMVWPPAHDRALEILRERYARGEIGKEEFEARRRDLT